MMDEQTAAIHRKVIAAVSAAIAYLPNANGAPALLKDAENMIDAATKPPDYDEGGAA